MRTTPYYSVRTGKHPGGSRLDLEGLKRLFTALFGELWERGHFQEFFGYDCVDAGPVAGKAGFDVESYVFLKLRKANLWPMGKHIQDYTEDDVFDVVEFLYDHVSKGTEGGYHNYAQCGWHYSGFDRGAGQSEFRTRTNEVLRDYADGFELSEQGEVLTLPHSELMGLMARPLPAVASTDVQTRINSASRKFRSRSWDDRRDAIRDLADVLESLRPEAKRVLLGADENDLFEIANRFGIRHHNQKQKIKYDKSVWFPWMFHYYLTTIHAMVHLMERGKK